MISCCWFFAAFANSLWVKPRRGVLGFRGAGGGGACPNLDPPTWILIGYCLTMQGQTDSMLLSTKLSSNCKGKVTAPYNAHLLQDLLVYPPKIYLPTLIIVTVGPLPSHREWNVLAAQPSTDARQQRFQREFTLFVTGASQFLNEVKWFLLFLTITEFSKPKEEHKTIFHYMRYKVFEISQKLNLFSLSY